MASTPVPTEAAAKSGYLIDRFEEHCRQRPEKPALVWVDAQGRDQQTYTYAELDSASQCLAEALMHEGLQRGDTAILAYAPGLDFYVAFFACLRAGIIAVPVSPPFSNSDVKKFLKIVNNSGARVILTDKFFARIVTMKIRKHKASQLGKGIASIFTRGGKNGSKLHFGALEPLWWITTSGMSTNDCSYPLLPQGPDATAFIMYSSGSTSAPKGALTSFVNLRHQFELIEQALGASSDHVSTWWAPHFHDFGLISGFLASLHQGCKSVVTSPMYFIQRPAVWLDMMHNHKATHTFGPDFGYLLLVKKTTSEDREVERWDLSHLKVAMSAAEKVRYKTLIAFTDAFSACGFRREAFCPAYGLAEHAVGVTINSYEQVPQVMTVRRQELEANGTVVAASEQEADVRVKQLVGSGTAWNNTDVRIVKLNEDGEPLGIAPADQVGEIWVSSLSKTLGYHKLPDATIEVFQARLPGVDVSSDDGKLEFLRTGDLGFWSSENDELFVCGRNKDMIIIAGKNHYSEDMELNIAEELRGFLRPGCIATFGVEDQDSGQEKLCVVAEAATLDIDRSECFHKIHECIAREHHISVSTIALVAGKTIPKTSSGKLRRFLIRERMLTDKLKIIKGGLWINEHSEDEMSASGQSQEEAEPAHPLSGDDSGSKSVEAASVDAPEESSNKAVPAATPRDDLAGRVGSFDRPSDYRRLLLDFRDFVSENGAPVALDVYFPESSEGFENWFFLIGYEGHYAVFDEDAFERMPVWNFTSVNPVLFNGENFSRWANDKTHRALKKRICEIIEKATPDTTTRTVKITQRFLEEWKEKESFSWFSEFDPFVADIFCEIFLGRTLPEAHQHFANVLFAVDPYRKHSLINLEVKHEDNIQEGLDARSILAEFMEDETTPDYPELAEHASFSNVLISMGCFAALPALKNVLVNLFAKISSEADIRNRIMEELNSLQRPLNQDELEQRVPYLDACVYEVIRLYPPVGHIYAKSKYDQHVMGAFIPEGANVAAHTWYSLRDPRFFKDPDVFDPERFLPPRSEHLAPEKPFIAFGVGEVEDGRACPGQKLALLAIKTAVATALLECDWQLARPAWDDTRYRERYGVPNFEDGMRVEGFREKSLEFTLESLRPFDGSDPTKPIYIGIAGMVYDCTPGRNYYGPGGPYQHLAGRDASKALAKMSMDATYLDDPNVEDLEPGERATLEQWVSQLSGKYECIGTLVGSSASEQADAFRTTGRTPVAWKVAVVGGGISGLACALALAEHGYKVTVFETNDELGGHACTKEVFGDHARAPAFGSFMANQWPNTCKIMELVGARRILECTDFDGNYDKRDPIVHFARDDHPISTDDIEEEAQRFFLEMLGILKDPNADSITVGDYLKDNDYSDAFISKFFIGRVIHYFAGQPIEYYLRYPLRLIAWMFVGITAEVESKSDVYRVHNREYIQAVRSYLEARRVRIVTGTFVEFEHRSDTQSTLRYDDTSEAFGHVVLAIQPQHAVLVLGHHITEDEINLLSQFAYTTDTAIVHQDPAWIPNNEQDAGLLNFLMPDQDAPEPKRGDTIPVTTKFPCDRDGTTTIFTTYNYAKAAQWPGTGRHQGFTFEHLSVTPDTQRLRHELKELQGHQTVHYCGSWSRGLTLHEDAVVTGLQAANRITGRLRQYPILEQNVVLPEPFEELKKSGSQETLGDTEEEIVKSIIELGREVLGTTLEIEPDTELSSLGLSSLDTARLVNALNELLPNQSLAVEEIYAIDTVAELAEHIWELDDDHIDHEPLSHAPQLTARASGGRHDATVGMPHPVSFAQAQILQSHFMSMQESGNWNIPLRTWLTGEVNESALKESIEHIAKRQAVLRTRFTLLEDGGFSQRIDAKLKDDYFSTRQVTNRQEAINIAIEESQRPLDVTHGVIRLTLIRIEEKLSLLVVVIHHAVADGWSLGVLVRELWEIYTELCRDQDLDHLSLPHLPLQFVDYAYWQHDLHKHHHYDSKMLYWRKQLSSPLPVLGLSDVRSGAGNTDAHIIAFQVPPEVVDSLKRVSREYRTSFNVVLLTIYATALCRQAGQDSVLVQVPIAGRSKETEQLIGCFAEALILKVSVSSDQFFREHVRQAHSQLYEGLKHAIPLTLLSNGLDVRPAEKLKMHRAVLHWEQTLSLRDTAQIEKGGLEAAPFEPGDQESAQIAAQTHSVLNINEQADGSMKGEWWFSRVAIPEETMLEVVECFKELMERAADSSQPPQMPTEPEEPQVGTSNSVLAPFAASTIFGDE